LKKSEAEKIALKHLVENDFSLFVQWIFLKHHKSPFVFKPFHAKICEKLQQAAEGKIKNLCINIPPRLGKTLIVELFIVWSYIRNRKSKFIYTSYSDKLVLRCSQEIKSYLTSDYFQEMWDIKLRTDTQSKREWETESGGTFYAVSLGGGITGFGAGVTGDEYGGAIIIDDPQKPRDRDSETMVENTIDYYTGTLKSRRNNPKHTPFILIMQRISIQDLVEWVKINEPDMWDFLEKLNRI